MAQDRKALLAVILAVKRGFVSPEEGMNLLDQAELEDTEAGAATIFDAIPHSQVDNLRHDATVLANDTEQAEQLMQDAGLSPEIQQTLLSLGKEPPRREEIEATLLSLSPKRQTTIIERPKLKTSNDDRYKILREHARGGMGRILVAEDKVVGREVALKELLPFKGTSGSSPLSSPLQGTPASATSTAAAARFLREATVTGQLEHPNIVPVYEIGQRDDGSIYYTMKFVKGRTLASRLRAIRTDVDLSPAQKLAERLKLLDGFADICNAIAFAHSRGVIHRDIKPANIMLGDFGEAMVLDWGLARVVGGENTAIAGESNMESSPELTLEGEVMGTPAYMPPEQAAGKLDQVDERSDVYALGAVLFEIVSGEAPYVGKTAKQVLSSVLSEDPRRVSDVSDDVPPELAALVMRCLERRPEDRFQSARTLAEEVQAFRDGRMVSTYRYSAIELVTRFVAKNRASVAVGVLAVILMIAGGVYAYAKVKGERDSAVAAEADALTQRTIAENQAIEAEKQAREAERQKGIADAQAEEAERQKGIAKDKAIEAEREKGTAVQKAAEAEFERKRADMKAAEAAQKADEARQSEERATRALEQARSNLAQAHLGYAKLAEERGQPGGQVLHLAAAHAADPSTVSSDLLVAALSENVAPIWRSRSYVDLPAGAAVFSPDRRLCAAPMHKPPKLITDFANSADATALPDIGIWDVATATLLRRISTESAAARAFVFNGDGTRLACMEGGGYLRLWDVTTGNEITSRAAYPWVDKPIITPGPKGESFFTAGSDGKIHEWSFNDGSSIRMREVKDQDYTALAVSPDGSMLAAGTGTSALVWNLLADDPPRELTGPEMGVSALTFVQDGLLLSLSSGELEVWDPATQARTRALDNWSWGTTAVEQSPDGKFLIVTQFDQGWKLVDYATGETVRQRSRASGRVQGIAFSPDSSALMVALRGEGFDVVGLDGHSLMERAFDHLLGSEALEISPDGRTFASGDQSGRLLVRKVADGSTVWSKQASTKGLLRVTFSPDGTLIAVYSGDETISLFDAANGNLLRFLKQPVNWMNLKFSSDGRFLIAPTSDGPVKLIDTRTATVRKTLKLPNDAVVYGLAFDPKQDRVWMTDGGFNQWVWEYDRSNIAVWVGRMTMKGQHYVNTTTISPDGKTIVSVFNGGTAVAWQPEPFNQIYFTQIGEGPIKNCAFGPSSEFFACGTGDGMLCIVNARNGRVVKKQRVHRSAVIGTAVSPDGRQIITSGVDGEFLAWEAPPLMHPEVFKLGVSTASQIAVSPDGHLSAVVTDSQFVKVFESDTGKVVADFDAIPWAFSALAFSSDGQRLAASHAGGKVLIWSATQKAVTTEIAVFDEPNSIAFDDNGRLVVNGLHYGVQVWSADGAEKLAHHTTAGGSSGMQLFPDGKRALQISATGESRILNLETGKVQVVFERAAYFAMANAISPDGTVVALMRDRGLIGIHDAETGARIRTLKVRPNYICGLQFFADGRRLFYVTESQGAAVVDVQTGQELAGTWFGRFYINTGVLSQDGEFALVVASGGEVERWHLGPVLARSRELAQLDVPTVIAMAQIRSGLILNNLETITLPRRTGRFTWQTPDGKPPEFLQGGLPAWAPKLAGAEVQRAREFLRGGSARRQSRIEKAAIAWIDQFEGYRYREVLESDLSTRRIELPPREKDESGQYIGEPQGRVDFTKWLAAMRQNEAEDTRLVAEKLKLAAEQRASTGDLHGAERLYYLSLSLQPRNHTMLLAFADVSLRLREPWSATWLISEQIEHVSSEQRTAMLLVWARLSALEYDYAEMLERFEAAQEAGYSTEDWHLYRVQGMEACGRYSEAVQSAELALLVVRDAVVRSEIMLVRNRCAVWRQLQATHTDLPRIVVTHVPVDSKSAAAGLKAGDVVLSVNFSEESRFQYLKFPSDALSFQKGWMEFLTTGDATIQTVTISVRRGTENVEIEYPRADFDAELFTLLASE